LLQEGIFKITLATDMVEPVIRRRRWNTFEDIDCLAIQSAISYWLRCGLPYGLW